MALIGVGWITDDGETDVNNIGNYFAGKQICFGMVSRTILSETITETWQKFDRNTHNSKTWQESTGWRLSNVSSFL